MFGLAGVNHQKASELNNTRIKIWVDSFGEAAAFALVSENCRNDALTSNWGC